jgi:hypothetical protein
LICFPFPYLADKYSMIVFASSSLVGAPMT